MSSQCWLAIVAALSLIVCHFPSVTGLDDGLAIQPPMGFRTWNGYDGDIDETLIKSIIVALTKRTRSVNGVPTSLSDLGYYRLGIDDGWQACGAGKSSSYHADDGTPLVNRTRFHNLKELVNIGHEHGLLMDFYHINCICLDSYILNKNRTWANLAWRGNVRQIRDAGFDGVKIDNCGDDDGLGYATMMDEIKQTGKPILVENCNQAHGHGPPRGLPTNASGWCDMHMYRTGGDIRSNFDDTMRKLQTTIPFQDVDQPISRPGCWAFPDMLEVGNFGSTDLATVESKSHFFAWCIVSSPLFISFDVTNDAIVDRIWPIISNLEAISINQEWAGHPGRLILTDGQGEIWTKKLKDGCQAVLFLNRGQEPITLSITLGELGVEAGEYLIRDIWRHRTLEKTVSNKLSAPKIGRHDCWFVKLSLPLKTNDFTTGNIIDAVSR